MAGELKFPRINSIMISGRVTRETELRYTTSGTAVTKLPIAFDRSYQRGNEWIQETSYIDVVVWDKLAERCAEYLDKGSAILVEGYLKTHT
ncbi:MAG: single-stranded DNA-binding protein, partial [Candidatus Cloacimonetes bacterium]|nr:single-stranded DNA-binding protein [Candidatus Cloacimonadota bacterium]